MNDSSANAPTAPAEVFSLDVEVEANDIDQLGHASNIAYVRWVQDAALAHSKAVGFGFEAYQELGAVFVVRRHEVDYLRPVLRGDRLQVRTWIDTVAAAKSKRATEILRLADLAEGLVTHKAQPTLVARAVTTWGFIEIASGRPTRIPDSVRVAFGHERLRPPSAPC